MGLQIVQQANLLFQLVESVTTHGLLASIGRIRQSVPRSQARMVGVRRKCWFWTPALSQHQKLTSRRCAHRRTVEESGKRVGSLQCGAACSAVSPAAMCSQACCRAMQAVVAGWRQPIGQDGKGLSTRLTDSAPHPDTFVLVIVSMAESSSVANDRVIPANGTSPRQEVHRDHPESPLSSASGSAIKRITAGVKAAADRRCQGFDLRPAFTLPAKSVSNEKRIPLSGFCRYPSLRTLAGFLAFLVKLHHASDLVRPVIKPELGQQISENPAIVQAVLSTPQATSAAAQFNKT